jgi:hypothetical protein
VTSSTSASEPVDPWARPTPRALGLGLALAVTVLVLTALGVRGLAARVENPRASQAVERVTSGAPWIVVGNSVAQSVVEPARLAERLGVDEVAQAAIDGALGPHVAALLRHHPPKAGATVVVLMPTHNLLAGRLPSETDRALLVELLRAPDAPLTSLAMGGAVSAVDLWRRDRLRARSALLGWVTATPLRIVGALSGVPVRVDETLSALGAEAGPVTGPSGPLPGAPPGRAVVEAEELPPEASVLPLLVEAAEAAEARLIVVVPFDRRRQDAPCRAAPEDEAGRWLVAHGVAVVDLRGAPLAASAFSREFHLHNTGRAQATDLLAEGLGAVAPGAYWSGACGR